MPLMRNGDFPLSVVGSYAKAIEPTLRAVMEGNGLKVSTIVADPIVGLRRFHSEK